MKAETTRDAYLGGRLFLRQPRNGYRAGVDPVLLAAAVDAVAGQSVLDLGCGVGAAALCLGTRVGGLDLTGVEVQPDYADLARQNAHDAGVAMHVVEADLSDLPTEVRNRQFDHVISNPPYFDPARRLPARDDGREVALAGATPLETWIDVAARRTAPKGFVTLIQRTERLPEVLRHMTARLGDVAVRPLAPRPGRAAHLVLVRGRKGGRGDFRLTAPLVMHAGSQHESDAEDYTPLIASVLRDGAALPAFTKP